MRKFAVGQWPAKSGGVLDAVFADDIHEVPNALFKRYNKEKTVVASRAGKYPGVLIDGVQFRIFDVQNVDDIEELILILARIGGGQGQLN
jgi:hypothetical protein